MKKLILCLFIFATLFVSASFAEEIPVTRAEHTVKIDGVTICPDSGEIKEDNSRYPVVTYKNVTYIPLTFYKANMLNLSLAFDGRTLSAAPGDPEVPKIFDSEGAALPDGAKFEMANFNIILNGTKIDNLKEEYPFLFFRGVVYMPVTWHNAVEVMGWTVEFSGGALSIDVDNCFYTLRQGARQDLTERPSFMPGPETYYRKGGLFVALDMSGSFTGRYGNNLRIINNGRELAPDGIFGHGSGGPRFSCDGEFVYTTVSESKDWPDTSKYRPCKINVSTGEVIYTD